VRNRCADASAMKHRQPLRSFRQEKTGQRLARLPGF